MCEIIVDTTFKKYGFENNIEIWSADWVTNNRNSGEVEYNFLVAKFVKHGYVKAMFAQIPVSYAEHHV